MLACMYVPEQDESIYWDCGTGLDSTVHYTDYSTVQTWYMSLTLQLMYLTLHIPPVQCPVSTAQCHL